MTSSNRRSGIKLNRPYVGILSFLRARIETDLDALDADVAVYGVPFDEGSPFLAGSRMGPRSLRHSLRFARTRLRNGKSIVVGSWLSAAGFYHRMEFRTPGAVFVVRDVQDTVGNETDLAGTGWRGSEF